MPDDPTPDIRTDRERAEAALRESERKYRSIFENSLDAIFLAVPGGPITAANPAACAMFGMTEEELCRVGRAGIEDPADPRHDAAVAERARTGRVKYEATHIRKDGSPFPSEVSSVIIDGGLRSLVFLRDVTERKEVEARAIRSAETFAQLVERAPFGIYVIDSQFRVAQMNAESQTGAFRHVRPLIGRDFAEAMHILWPDDVAGQIIAAFRRTLDTGEPYYSPRFVNPRHDVAAVESYEWELHRMTLPDGHYGVICYYFDSTKLREAEAAARESDERLRFATEACHIGAWDIDLENHTAFRSLEHDRIFGYTDLLPQWTLDDFLRHALPEYRAPVEAMVRDATAAGCGWTYECPIRRTDGEIRWIWFSGRHHTDAAGHARVVGVVQDITERKQAERALREANAQLADAHRRKDEFLAVLSHELRNPLAPIRYALPLIQREPLPDASARALAVIERQVAHLTRLVDDLLDVSRITSDKIELRPELVTLASVLAAASESAAPAIAAARHMLKQTIPDEALWLNADPARLTQAITNLLNNSAKFTPRGGLIELEAVREGGEGVVRVRDSGVGIPREALPRIFEMFHQVHRVDMSHGGLGIGLSLTKRLVEMHAGTIYAHSDGVGRGAVFTIRLPLAERGAVDGKATAALTPAGSRRLKVLVVDDNADLVDMLALVVEAAGHDVRKALDGRSAIAAALVYRPDVVLLDLGLPIRSGIEVARELRRQPETAHARLVALTGWGQPEDRYQTETAGFDHHLTKPADPKALERLLAEYANEAGD